MTANVTTCRFEGFSNRSIDFLRQVRDRNSREWFGQHREEYNLLLLNPFAALVADLSSAMLAIDPEFEVRPAIDRTISRIHRDTRFSRDKSLYRDAMWFTFKRPDKGWRDAPGYFFELTPTAYRYGMGYFAASRATMDRLRRRIDDDPQSFRQVISFMSTVPEVVLEGEQYRRRLPSEHPADLDTWYQRKSFYLACNREIDDRLFSPELVQDLVAVFTPAAPLYRYLNELRHDDTRPV